MIGVPLEMVHGILRISLLYMAGVLAGEDQLKCVFHSANSTELGFGHKAKNNHAADKTGKNHCSNNLYIYRI